MFEQQLKRLLHDAAGALEIPADLFPGAERLAAAPRHRGRRRAWQLVAGAAAVLVALTGFTPLGRAAVQKVGAVVMAFWIEEIDPAVWQRMLERAPEPPKDYKPMQPGEVRYEHWPPETFRKPTVYRALTVETLQQQYAERPWPLPTYLPPPADRMVQVIESYDVYDEPELIDLNYGYKVTLRGREHSVGMRIARVGRKYDNLPAWMDERIIYVPPGSLEAVRDVEVKGITATAYKEQGGWTIAWFPPDINQSKHRAYSYVRSDTLPLEELAKIVESMPSWD